MADKPETKRELLIRGDAGYKFSAGVGQWTEPVAPVKPTDLDGTKVPVWWYLDPEKIGPNDGVAPKNNDDNNQEEIKKTKKKKIKWYVKITGGSEQHHDDYSYHGYPWDSRGSSSSSMSPAYSSVPSEDQSAGGWGLPLPSGFDPNGTLYTVIGEVAPSDVTNAPTQQVQFGGALPASPQLSQRFNVLPYRANLIPTALRTFRKLKGITDLELTFYAKASHPIPGGESVEMNVTLIPMEGLNVPSNVYRKAFIVDDTWPGGPTDPWKKQVLRFEGFNAAEEYPVTFAIHRRSDVSPNYSGTEIWVMYTQIVNAR